MTSSVGSGVLTIKAAISDGHVRAAEIVSTRPYSMARLFIGRRADEAPVLAGRLFSLCGYSHSTASSLAIAAARGKPIKDKSFAVGVLAERLGDMFRSLVMGWPDVGLGGFVLARDAGLIRDALSACRELVGGTASQNGAIGRVISGAESLGLGKNDNVLQQALSALPDESGFLSIPPDVLTEDDDESVCDGLSFHGEAFSQTPHLVGRCPETGAYAQHFPQLDHSGSALVDRMCARFMFLEAGLRHLSDPESSTLWSSGILRPGQGFGAVESPRGRLYHWAKVDSDGIVVDYGIVSPTEWNFHPAGPFVATLLGSKVGAADKAQSMIAWLAALFDPCVAFRVVLAEGGHA